MRSRIELVVVCLVLAGGSSTSLGLEVAVEPGCIAWPAPGLALQEALKRHGCVQILPGTHELSEPVTLPANSAVIGSGRDRTVLRAAQGWVFDEADAMLGTPNGVTGVRIAQLTIDGRGLATYGAGFGGMVIDRVRITRTRCSAVGITAPGFVLTNSILDRNAQPSLQPGRGRVGCETVPDNWTARRGNLPYGGVSLGAAIAGIGTDYKKRHSVRADFAPVITSNVISGSYGPALDNAGVWNGVFSDNDVHDNSGWAAVSLFGSGGWTVANNVIRHTNADPGQPYHPLCATGPAGSHSAAILLCQDTDEDGMETVGNRIENNQVSSFYGILVAGGVPSPRTGRIEKAPRSNLLINNNVIGSNFGCADSYPPGLPDSNTWRFNTCQGTPNSPPAYFTSAAGLPR